MRKLKGLLLVAFVALSMTGVANAQKIGHVNYERVIANMPETRTLQGELDKIGKTYKDDLESSAKKLEAKMKKYSAEQSSQTQQVNEQRAIEVQGDRTRITQAEQAAYQDLQDKQNKGLIPIIKKINEAVKALAKEKGILYVLDSSVGKGLLVADGEDLYGALKVKLGLLPDQKPPQQAAKN